MSEAWQEARIADAKRRYVEGNGTVEGLEEELEYIFGMRAPRPTNYTQFQRARFEFERRLVHWDVDSSGAM